jgi:phage terminase large subunit GpA-like protein
VELGAERIYVLPTQERWNALRRPPSGALDTAVYALSVLVDARLEADIERYSSEVELTVLPAPNPRQVQPTDFDHSSHLIGQSHAACRSQLARGGAIHERVSSSPGAPIRPALAKGASQ